MPARRAAANAVISRNKGRKAKNLWSDAGDGEQIIGFVADDVAPHVEPDRPGV